MDGSADKGVAVRDHLTDVHRVADLYHWLARRADMLRHGQGDHSRYGHLNALFVSGVFVMGSVYAALGSVRPLRKAELSHIIPPNSLLGKICTWIVWFCLIHQQS